MHLNNHWQLSESAAREKDISAEAPGHPGESILCEFCFVILLSMASTDEILSCGPLIPCVKNEL